MLRITIINLLVFTSLFSQLAEISLDTKGQVIKGDKPPVAVQRNESINITQVNLPQSTESCFLDSQCSLNAVCREQKCRCQHGFDTSYDEDSEIPVEDRVPCNYKRRSRSTALLLNTLSGGANGNAEWYMGEDALSWTRFSLTGGGAGISIFFRIYKVQTDKTGAEKYVDVKTAITLAAINLAAALANQIIGMVDNIRYRYIETDGNGVPTIE